MKPIDLLNLEWTSSPSRDTMMSTLVCNYLRIQGLNVLQGSIFDGLTRIHQGQPRLFFIANTVGAQENYEVMLYAKARGCLGLSLISEGNFREEYEYAQEMIWGWNKSKRLNEDLHLQWSERTRKITLSHHPELSTQIKISGGVGFDAYRIRKGVSRQHILKKYSKEQYQKVIGVGLWDFGCWYPQDSRYGVTSMLLPEDAILRFRQDGLRFNQELFHTIQNNPDKLFLLKQHPGVLLGYMASGIDGLDAFENVLILKNEENIIDCISISDFWLVYESTTALEAWLLGKQTCLLNPSGRDFPRDQVHHGSPDYQSGKQLSLAIDAFYQSQGLPGFEARNSDRCKIIENTIQWDDGLNHVRAGNAILELLTQSREWKPEPRPWSKKRIKQHLKWLMAKMGLKFGSLKALHQRYMDWNPQQFGEFQEQLYQDQLAFYQKNNLSLDELRKITTK